MDVEKYKLAAAAADVKFAQSHNGFLHWWSRHPDRGGDPDKLGRSNGLQYAVPARVAWTVAKYRDEYNATS